MHDRSSSHDLEPSPRVGEHEYLWGLLRAMLDSVSEVLIVADADARIVSCNAHALQLFEVVEGELIGAPISRLLAGRERTTHALRLADLIATIARGSARGHRGERVTSANLCLSAETQRAKLLPIELRLRLIEGSAVALVLVTVRDLREREPRDSRPSVQGGARSRAQERLDRAPHGTALLDRAGVVTALNEPWLQLDAVDAESTMLWADLGQSLLACCDRVGSLDAARMRSGILAVLSGDRDTHDQTYRCHSFGRLRWFRMQAHTLDSLSGAALVSQLDVTDVQVAYAHLSIQNAVAKAFNSQLPLLAACRQLALTLCDELDWEYAGIWTLDTATWTLRCVDTWVRPELLLQDFERASRAAALAPGSGMPGKAWASARVQFAADVDLDRDARHLGRPTATVMPPLALSVGFRSALCFPLKCGGDVLAVVEVFSRVRRPEDPALMALLDVAGDQLALWELRERAESYAVRTQQNADDARAQLEAVLACTPAFITAIDREENIMFVNKTIPPERKLGAVGTPWRDFVVPEFHARVESALRAVFTSGTSSSYEAKILIPGDRWLWFANYMGPMRNGDAIVGAVIVSQDVTAEKRQHEELLAAQRLAAVGTLAAGVAHEINTPIQFLSDSIHFLRDATADVFVLLGELQTFYQMASGQAEPELMRQAGLAVEKAEQNTDLAYMHENVPRAFDRCVDGLERVATIVSSMKEFARPPQKEMVAVDLNRAITSTLTIARNEYKYVADLETDLQALPAVTCHANEINQVILNIVVNAAHAIADFPQASGRGLITVKTRRNGEFVVISIGDTGGGVPEALGSQIFDPFFTTKEVGRGTGQGLSIAWTIVKEKHGGELSFDSQVGLGTTFHVRLPIAGTPHQLELSA